MPNQPLASEAAVPAPLSHLRIGLSISESPDDDLAARGLGRMHLDHAFVEIARHLLAAGASLTYGGDHRVAGFSQILFDLVRTYDLPDKPDPERIRNYLAWPLYLSLKAADRAALKTVAKIIEVPPPADLNLDAKTFIAPDTAEGRRIWSRCLTAMRHRMNDQTDARIFLGGRLTGFKGKYPGLVEEAHLALIVGKPVFLLGGFGGCAAALIEALRGHTPDALTLDHHRHADNLYAEMLDTQSLDPDPPVDYVAILSDLHRTGTNNWPNGLSAPDNERLFATDDIDEMVALVLKGLVQSR